MTRLMIVAHPDDETIFGAQALPDAHVVCVTCGSDPVRSAEFKAVLAAAGATGTIWDYRDSIDGWNVQELKRLRGDLLTIIRETTPAMVVTHNAAGEYGHPQHQQLHQLIRGFAGVRRLRTFGLGELSQADRDFKRGLLSLYRSQSVTLALPLLAEWIDAGTVNGLVAAPNRTVEQRLSVRRSNGSASLGRRG